MSLKIQRITEDVQTYTIPAVGSDDVYVEITVPDWDCQKKGDLKAIDALTQEKGIQVFQTEGIRLALKHYNPDEEDAIDQLVTRQLLNIGNDWAASDKSGLLGGDDKGEGETESSKSSASSKKKKN